MARCGIQASRETFSEAITVFQVNWHQDVDDRPLLNVDGKEL